MGLLSPLLNHLCLFGPRGLLSPLGLFGPKLPPEVSGLDLPGFWGLLGLHGLKVYRSKTSQQSKGSKGTFQ